MIKINLLHWASLVLFVPIFACTIVKQTPQPVVEVEQLNFEIQTATPTVSLLFDAPTYTPDPNATATPTSTPTLSATLTAQPQITQTVETAPVEATAAPPPPAEEVAAPAPPPATATPEPAPTAEPLQGGEWDFEAGFAPWINPFGDSCDGSGLAIGWSAFTTEDAYGSSCMNQTTWAGNVHSGESAQEITFGFVGNKAGIFRPAPTTPGHNYAVAAFMRREFSPAKVEVLLGVDATGGTDWQAETVQWFPWNEDLDDQWAKTEATVTATGETMTIFIKGDHPFPEAGGALRLDSVSVTDLGTE